MMKFWYEMTHNMLVVTGLRADFFFFLFPVSICHLIWMNGGMNVTKMNQLSNLMCKADAIANTNKTKQNNLLH